MGDRCTYAIVILMKYEINLTYVAIASSIFFLKNTFFYFFFFIFFSLFATDNTFIYKQKCCPCDLIERKDIRNSHY